MSGGEILGEVVSSIALAGFPVDFELALFYSTLH
jgi:hypothetical protein